MKFTYFIIGLLIGSVACAKINFIGDWGDCKSTTPTGPLDKQQRVADVFNSLPEDYLFTVSLGDNFYPTGVVNSNDWKFTNLWQNVYHDNKPWYIIAGNHDYYGNLTAEFEYSKKVPKWVYPSNYYDLYVPQSDAYLIFLDTEFIVNATKTIPASKKAELLVWFESKLQAAQNSSWIIVIGHYNIYSGEARKEEAAMRNDVLPLLKKYKVNLYICGHNHLSEFIYFDNIAYIVNGDGGRYQDGKYDPYRQPQAVFYNDYDIGSFNQLDFLDKDRLKISFFLADVQRTVVNYVINNVRNQKFLQ